MVKQIFVNVMVQDLQKSKDFFSKCGFTFNPQFTDEKAACLILGENIYAMLIIPKFFTTFTKKSPADAHATTEVLTALALESKAKVDEVASNALDAGGKAARDIEDHGWMYTRSIEDLDGHIWEFFYMDLTKAPK